MLICGASFAGLAVARELAGSGADVLVVDRYEIGERQTSACGIPTEWLRAMGLMEAERQRFDSLLDAHPARRLPLPAALDLLHLRLPRALRAALARVRRRRFETAKVNGRARSANGDGAIAVETDRGVLSAPLVVDALGWRRVLASGDGYQPPDAPLSRGLEVHPEGSGEDLEIWIDRRYVPAGYGWSFPADDELRIGVGSFDPRFHVKDTTVLLAEDLERRPGPLPGQLDPHKLRRGDRGRRLLRRRLGRALPAAHRRGDPYRLLLRDRLRTRAARASSTGGRTASRRPSRYAEFNDSHEWKFRWMLRVQRLVPRVPPRMLRAGDAPCLARKRFVDWSFGHYLQIAPPEFATSANDQNGAGEQQHDPKHALGAERNLV